jgi:hypothetical protein
MAATPENIELSKKMLKEVAEATTKKRRPKEGADKGGVAAGAGGAGAAASSSAVASATVSGHKRKLVAVKETVRLANCLFILFYEDFSLPQACLFGDTPRYPFPRISVPTARLQEDKAEVVVFAPAPAPIPVVVVPQLKFLMPPMLKKQLVDDWDRIQKCVSSILR